MIPSQQVRAGMWLAYRTLFAGWARIKKYFWFVVALKLYKFVTLLCLEPSKGKLLEAFYLVNRYIDDVADEDALSGIGLEARIQYIERKKYFTINPTDPQDEIEFLILYYQELARQRGENYTPEAVYIIDSMLFDSQRLYSGRIFSASDLQHNYHLLDEQGTVRPMLKLFNESADRFSDLAALAKAVRIAYNLRDLQSDIAKGLINIPREDIDAYGLREVYTLVCQTESVSVLSRWLKDQANIGLRLLVTHRRQLARKAFGIFTRFVLWIVYERSAEALLKKIYKRTAL